MKTFEEALATTRAELQKLQGSDAACAQELTRRMEAELTGKARTMSGGAVYFEDCLYQALRKARVYTTPLDVVLLMRALMNILDDTPDEYLRCPCCEDEVAE